MTEDRSSGSQFERWVSFGTTILAPVTVLSALLFYFGYVSTRSQYEYFGVDVDTIGLSTQDYVMRSPQPLLVPLLALTLAGAGFLTLHAAVRGKIVSAVLAAEEDDATERAEPARQVQHLRRIARMWAAGGLAVLGVGVLLLFAYGYVREWPLYNFVTPMLITVGATLTAYVTRVVNLLDRLEKQHVQALMTDGGHGPTAPGYSGSSLLLRRTVDVLIYVVVATSLFWATATVAQWSGRGVARHDAQHLNSRPSVILDTKERLFLRAPGIEETALPVSEGQTFRYRYRRLRLLIHGHDRMFLVPDKWSASNSTLVVPLDGSVRVQFQFENQPP